MGTAPPRGSDPYHLPDPMLSDKCTPSQDCWPSQETWQAFNQTIGGNLIATNPANQVCFDEPDGVECHDVQTRYTDAWFVGNQPGASMMPIWDCGMQDDCCWPGATETCGRGEVPLYTVNATTTEHVQQSV